MKTLKKSQDLVEFIYLNSGGDLVSTGHVGTRSRAEDVGWPRKKTGKNLNANNDFAMAA
jgi:hypothetical protein